jgi:hypothetical protein
MGAPIQTIQGHGWAVSTVVGCEWSNSRSSRHRQDDIPAPVKTPWRHTRTDIAPHTRTAPLNWSGHVQNIRYVGSRAQSWAMIIIYLKEIRKNVQPWYLNLETLEYGAEMPATEPRNSNPRIHTQSVHGGEWPVSSNHRPHGEPSHIHCITGRLVIRYWWRLVTTGNLNTQRWWPFEV